jgi:hypothetical protein
LNRWKDFLDSPAVFDLKLPAKVDAVRWDVILEDAPAGWYETAPGRMKSIAAASRMAGKAGDVFVHDCNCVVEELFSDSYLKNENLIAEVQKLRHFRIRLHNA